MKRQKKRGTKHQSEARDHFSEDTSQIFNPTRHGLMDLDNRIITMERVARGRGRQKIAAPPNGPRHQRRPSSVPSRTSQPIHTHTYKQVPAHQDKDESGNKTQASNIRNRCGWCELKSRRRGGQTSRTGRRLVETRGSERLGGKWGLHPSSSSDSMEHYPDLPTSPGPARYQEDSPARPDPQTYKTTRPDILNYSTASRDNGDFQHTQKRLAYRDSDRCNRSGAGEYPWCPPYQSTTYNNSNASFQRAVKKYDYSDLSVNEKNQHWSCAPDYSSLTGTNLKYDSKADYLLAKYSNYNNYPRMRSPTTPFLPYKSSCVRSVMSERGNSAAQHGSLARQYLGWSNGLHGLESSHSLHNVNSNYNKCQADPYSHTPIPLPRPKNPNWAEKLWQKERHSSVRFKLRNQTKSLLWSSTDSKWLQPWMSLSSWTTQNSRSPWKISRPLAETDSSICDKLTERQSNNVFSNMSGNNATSYLYGQKFSKLLSSISFPGRDVIKGNYWWTTRTSDKKAHLNLISTSSHSATADQESSLLQQYPNRSPCKDGIASNNSASSSSFPYHDPVSMSNKRCATNSGYVQLLQLEQKHLSRPHALITSLSGSDQRSAKSLQSIKPAQTAAGGPVGRRSSSADRSQADGQRVSRTKDTCQQP